MIYFIGNSDYKNKATLQECFDYCFKKEILGIDIETTRLYKQGTYDESEYKAGLDPYLSKICMLQIGDIENQYVIDTRVIDISLLIPIFKTNILFVGHYLKFEYIHLKHNYNIVLENIYDTMLSDQVIFNGLGKSKDNPEGLRFSLEALCDRYLGIKKQDNNLFNQDEDDETIDKSTRLGFINIGDRDFTEKEIEYGAKDIEYPLLIKSLQEQNSYFPKECLSLEFEFEKVLGDIELKGINFDKEKWINTYNEKLPIYEFRLKKLNTFIEQNYKNFCTIPDLFNTEQNCDILWSSPDQVIQFLRFLNICPKEKSKQTKKMEWTCGAKSVLKLLPRNLKELYEKDIDIDITDINTFLLNYLLWNKSKQCCTTFGEEWLKNIHPITKRVHTSYTQILNTGRISSRNPNLQNLPADESYRQCFIQSIGNKFLNCDFSSQESRVLAEVSGDKKMLDFFNNGHPIHKTDFHSFTGTNMFSLLRNDPDLIINKKDFPEERQIAKTISFKVAYGGSAYTLKDDFGTSEEEAQLFIDNFLNAFPDLKSYFKNCEENVLKTGYIIIDKTTNRRWFSPDFDKLEKINKEIWSYFPDNYRKLSKEQREKVKKEVYLKNPHVKDMWSLYFTIQSSLKRTSLNYPIQGLAGSQTKKSAVLFRKYCIENNLQDKLFLVNLIHDECSAEVNENFAEKGLQILKSKMIEGAQFFCEKVKMDAEGNINTNWSK